MVNWNPTVNKLPIFNNFRLIDFEFEQNGIWRFFLGLLREP